MATLLDYDALAAETARSPKPLYIWPNLRNILQADPNADVPYKAVDQATVGLARALTFLCDRCGTFSLNLGDTQAHWEEILNAIDGQDPALLAALSPALRLAPFPTVSASPEDRGVGFTADMDTHADQVALALASFAAHSVTAAPLLLVNHEIVYASDAEREADNERFKVLVDVIREVWGSDIEVEFYGDGSRQPDLNQDTGWKTWPQRLAGLLDGVHGSVSLYKHEIWRNLEINRAQLRYLAPWITLGEGYPTTTASISGPAYQTNLSVADGPYMTWSYWGGRLFNRAQFNNTDAKLEYYGPAYAAADHETLYADSGTFPSNEFWFHLRAWLLGAANQAYSAPTTVEV
jgi:hypothetical protein